METNLRPTFLTVLCILTFIFSGYQIFNGITTYLSADTVVNMTKDVIEETKDKIEEQSKDDKGAAFANKIMNAVTDGVTTQNLKNNAIATVIASILTLLGAVLMWGLNKKGFWLYVIGTGVTIIAPVIIYSGSFIGLVGAAGQTFLGAIFCVLYGLNFKSMR